MQAHELFKTIFAHDILLSPSMLEQGLSNLGNTQNLHRALLKLLTGEATGGQSCWCLHFAISGAN